MDDTLSEAAISVPGLHVRVLERCTSTNALVLQGELAPPCLLAAEEQTAGRGRRGRRWYSVRGASATFSVGRRVRRPTRELAGLSLVAGVAAAQALRALGAEQTRLKWPNDLVIGEDKLGGILVETRAKAGAVLAVIGIGINCRESAELRARVRRGVTFLERFVELPSRNDVIAAVAQRLVVALDGFETSGLEPTRSEWQALDALAGQRMRVRLADGRVLAGVASGLAEDGALRLRTARGMLSVASATVVAARRRAA
ncbi:MAG TPA: biotin--[acetyl-CoA-carboxylase] ligase [Burkholderiales bacterium]|nr:biotin--[acetyl-CoA-carboxylase] ligase [Burkholderiales bacterium]